jgi:hypothetical protein
MRLVRKADSDLSDEYRYGRFVLRESTSDWVSVSGKT